MCVYSDKMSEIALYQLAVINVARSHKVGKT